MEKQILTDPMIKPEGNVLENALGKNYKRFNEFIEIINTQNIVLEWNYYNDGKSWLGKLLYKKKNLCWLSIWNTGFKLTFFFTEKTIGGVQELEIDEEIKSMAKTSKPTGKLLPVIFLISNKNKMNDGVRVLEYKRGVK